MSSAASPAAAAGSPAPTAATVSIVVPVLDEAPGVAAFLAGLHARFPGTEVVVVDGGSTDGTPDLVAPPARLVRSRRGRGHQLNAGAAAASGDVLWFVHADTTVEAAALGQLRAAVADPATSYGGLTLAFDTRSAALDALRWSSNLRARRLGWVFGDQAMFVRRSAFDAVGGFPEVPLMEDLEISRRLRRTGRPVQLAATSTASARRFTERGTWRTVALMQVLKAQHLAGTDPEVLARRYGSWTRATAPRAGSPTSPPTRPARPARPEEATPRGAH